MNDPYIKEIIQSVEQAEKAVEDVRPELHQKQQKASQRRKWIRRMFKRNSEKKKSK